MWLLKGRPDWLAELHGLLTAVLVVAPLVMLWHVGPALANGHIGPYVRASEVAGVAGATGGLGPGAEVAGGSQVEVVVLDPSAGQVGAWLVTWLPSSALFLIVVVMLRRLVREARRADPFAMATVRRLRTLAVVTLAGGVVAGLLESVAEVVAAGLALDSGIGGGPYPFTVVLAAATNSFPAAAFLAGCAFVVIAEVVRRGCAMRAELETVI